MDALELILLYDYYGNLLTARQRECFELRYYQDLSLGEIGELEGISRQAVCDNLSRTEALLRRMEANIGCVSRARKVRDAMNTILDAAGALTDHPDNTVSHMARQIAAAAQELKE